MLEHLARLLAHMRREMESLEVKPRVLIKEARLLRASLGFPQAIWVE